MRVIQNPKRKNVGKAHYKLPSCVTVYADHAEVEVHNDDRPHLIDVADVEEVAKHRWAKDGKGYAACYINKHRVYLYRLLYDVVPAGLQLDHIDRDKRNNRRANLRVATQAENNYNRPRRCDNTSGVAGVSWYARQETWRAQIQIRGKKHHLGYFDSFDDAVAARKAAEIEFFGAFAPIA